MVRFVLEEGKTNPKTNEKGELYEENRRLRKKLEEMEKENRFLKKAGHIFKETGNQPEHNHST